MIVKEYYINEKPIQAQVDTGLAADEIEAIVGRFAPHSARHGQLRGKIQIRSDETVFIKHHFTGVVLWTNNPEAHPINNLLEEL